MQRLLPLTAIILVAAGCSQPISPPDLCDMPPGFRSWAGTTVEWSGAVVGGEPHGYVLACEKWRGGIGLDWSEDTGGVAAFEEALDRHRFDPGVLRIRAKGRIRSNEDGTATLQLSAISAVSFEPMTEAEQDQYWETQISSQRGERAP